ncbi:MAG: PQQ-like beta-propeller repeat protein [Planctomycetaceae bacterium]|nr:PQQ-like beta-propeller repeat protein [Planctomycetaceae bacterium]
MADDWPQWMGPHRDGIWRESGILDKFPADGPKILWRTPIGGGYAGPAVVGDHVYVTDKVVTEGADPSNPFQRGQTPSSERILCLNRESGEVIWEHKYPCVYTVSYPAGPRTTPVVADGRLYTLGAEGDLLCLNSADGEVVWHVKLKDEYGINPSPVWGFSSNPLLDGDRLICFVGGQGTAVVAFDKKSGKEIWRSLDAVGPHGPGYSSPIIIEAAGQRQLIVWHPQAVSSLVPETGKVIWQQRFPLNEGLSVATPRVDDTRLFVPSFYNGSMLLSLDQRTPGAKVEWQRHGDNERKTDALHSLIVTPFLEDDLIFGVDSYGELRALEVSNGDRIWETFEATSGRSARWGTAFIVKHKDRYVLFSEQGDLIFAKMDRQGYHEISRAHVIEPTGPAQRRDVVWTHPAFAHKCAFVRNDKEIVCVSLAE